MNSNDSVTEDETSGVRLEEVGEGRALHLSPGQSSLLRFCVQKEKKNMGAGELPSSTVPVRHLGMQEWTEGTFPFTLLPPAMAKRLELPG